MNETIDTQKEEIEHNGKYWAGRVLKVLKEKEEEPTHANALEVLAILDADYNTTDQYDVDEFDFFLDEFEEALEAKEEQKKAGVLEDHIDKAKGGDSEAEENEAEENDTSE